MKIEDQNLTYEMVAILSGLSVKQVKREIARRKLTSLQASVVREWLIGRLRKEIETKTVKDLKTVGLLDRRYKPNWREKWRRKHPKKDNDALDLRKILPPGVLVPD